MPSKKKMSSQKNAHSKKTNGKSVISPIVAGVTGAAVGAGVGVVASAALNDEKNRKKVGEALQVVRDQAIRVMDTMNTKENIETGKRAAKKMIDNSTKKIEHSTRKAINGRRQHAHA